MNYSYEIKSVGEDLIILEQTSSGVNKWNLLTLIDKDSVLGFGSESFTRARNWVLQNHPELLL
jgi:hypothetical protein